MSKPRKTLLGSDHREYGETSDEEGEWWEEEEDEDEEDTDELEDDEEEESDEFADALTAVKALMEELVDTDADEDDVEEAEEKLSEAEDLLEQANDALEYDDSEGAADLASEAEDVAIEGLEALGVEYGEEEWDDDEDPDDFHTAFEDGSSPEERVEGVLKELLPTSRTTVDCVVVKKIGGDTLEACAKNGINGREVQITEALVKACDDDELAFVLAHEIAHHENDDSVRRRQAAEESVQSITESIEALNQRMSKKGRGLLLRGLAVGGAGLLGYVRHKRHMLEVSRDHEESADARAAELMSEAGYDATAIEGALAKIHGGHLPNVNYFDSLRSTHPNPAERGRKARKQKK